VYDRILKQMREKIRSRQHVMTIHAEEEMAADNLSIFDVERAILNGKIIERQKDQDTAECKYLVEGETIASGLVVVVARISVTGKLVIITVYMVREKR
jgi:hypothetical protein